MPEMMVGSADDSRVRGLEDKLSEIEDYQLLNKLDIIAIKEQLEHIGTMSQALSPETQQRLAWVEQITKSDKFQSIEKLIDEVHNIESILEQTKTGLSAEQIENLKKEVSAKVEQDVSLLKERLENAPLGKIAVVAGPDANVAELEKTVEALKSKISAIENAKKIEGPPVGLTQADKDAMVQEFESRLQESTNKIYSEMRTSLKGVGEEVSTDTQSIKSLISLKKDTADFKTEIKGDLEAKFADLQGRLKPLEDYSTFKDELRAEVDKIRDFAMRDLNEKMNELQLTMAKSGMDQTKREIYEDFHKFKISIIDQISKSAEDVEAKVMPQVNSWRSEAEGALQKNKDAYAELVKFRISTMDEIDKKSKEIKDSLMIQVPAEIHAMRVDLDKKIDQFQQQVSEIKLLKVDVDDFRKKLERSKVGELDRLAGDVERVKARSEWLEDELLKKDITAITERLDELETEITKTRAMMPVVLE